MFKEYLKELLGSDFNGVWESFFAPKKAGFFITDTSAKAEILAQFSGAKELFSGFYIYDDKAALSHSEFFSKGQIYIQNASSYLATLFLGLCSGDEFCDMCASPGGKSIALFSKARVGGVDINGAVIEYDKSRFFTLKQNLEKYGFKGIRAYNKDARSIAKSCTNRFDKIMLDAPCSSYSHFGEGFSEKSPKELKAISKLQKGLLNAALCALKDGGEMIYSTCTFFGAENEEVIENALNSRFKLEILPLDFGQFFDDSKEFNALKIMPRKYGVLILPDEIYSGFYICKLRKVRQKEQI